jgi:hypothetical protein
MSGTHLQNVLHSIAVKLVAYLNKEDEKKDPKGTLL